MTEPRTAPLWLVVNAASGSNSEAAVASLTQALAASGHAPDRTVCFPDDELPTRALLEAEDVATLAIFTGDGTINSQVALLHGWPGHVLILPGGTQNLLSKALHGDVDAVTIAARLGTETMRSVARTAVKTSQGHALVEVLAGPGAMWADVREGLRDRDVGTIASALGEAMRQTASGAPVHVVDPVSGKPEGYRAVRIDADAGTLTFDGYDATTIGEFAAHGLATLVRQDFRAGPHDALGTAPRITCRSDDPIALMIDGERFDGAREETFACAELPVRFLASINHQESTAGD